MYFGNWILISPALYLCAAAIVVLLLGVVAAKRPDKGLDHYLPSQYLAPALMVPGLVLAGGVLAISLKLGDVLEQVAVGNELVTTQAFNMFVTSGGHAQLTIDPFAAILSIVAIVGTLIVMLLSLDHFGEYQIHKAEYYSLLMFATAAACFTAASSDLIAIYLSIEFLSLTSYVLAAFAKTDRRSAEAGLKYFLYGAASSAIMLYGMSILFGVTGGGTALSAIAAGFKANGAAASGAGWVGVMFTLVGFGFKLALVPFQFWAPDTYEGAPTPVTAFLSVVSKAAGIAVIVRFLTVVAVPAGALMFSWYWILVVLTGASMLFGNLVAISQRNIKRMLAYSSIAQVGYIMIGVLTAMHIFNNVSATGASVQANLSGPASDTSGLLWGLQGVLIYIIAYLFMNLGAFAVVVAVGKRLGSDQIESYAGLKKRSPYFASALAVFLFSLGGIPPTAGFLGKFFIFGGALKIGLIQYSGHLLCPELIVLAVLGVINSVISVYYYLNVVRLMFFVESESKSDIRGSVGVNAAIALALVVTLALVVFAKPVSDLTVKAVSHSQIGITRVR